MLDFYPREYRLTEDDIRQYAAIYTARIKLYKEYDGPLDAAYIRRLLDEERLMKNRESDGFRLQLDFRWYVELHKEDGPRVAPFKYAIEAYCLDNIQRFARRYFSMKEALLHCQTDSMKIPSYRTATHPSKIIFPNIPNNDKSNYHIWQRCHQILQ